MRCLRCGEELRPADGVAQLEDPQGSFICADYTGHDELGRYGPLHALQPAELQYDERDGVHHDSESCPLCEAWEQSLADDELAEAGVL